MLEAIRGGSWLLGVGRLPDTGLRKIVALVEWKRIPERERDELITRLNGAREIGEDG